MTWAGPGVPVMVTVREYPVPHCDDRNQATGGPVRVLAPKGQALSARGRAPDLGPASEGRPTGEAGGRLPGGREQ